MAKRKEAPVEDWITTTQAAELLGITPQYLGELIRGGAFKARKVNPRLLLVNRQSLEGWERKRKPKREKTIEG